jgi:hypothetical protein
MPLFTYFWGKGMPNAGNKHNPYAFFAFQKNYVKIPASMKKLRET